MTSLRLRVFLHFDIDFLYVANTYIEVGKKTPPPKWLKNQ